jgi:hypothetical protein
MISLIGQSYWVKCQFSRLRTNESAAANAVLGCRSIFVQMGQIEPRSSPEDSMLDEPDLLGRSRDLVRSYCRMNY